jgi:hypothetical protein
MKTGRNSPCPCGSGLKYQQCCELKEGKTSQMMVIIALLAGAVIVGVAMFVTKDTSQPPVSGAPVAPVTAGAPQTDGIPGSPQPPGPVPPGKIWNVEHGHWHDAPGAAGTQPGAAQPLTPQTGAQPAAQPTFTPGPQPPGPVPAGKVWSTEHGHWHDAPK